MEAGSGSIYLFLLTTWEPKDTIKSVCKMRQAAKSEPY